MTGRYVVREVARQDCPGYGWYVLDTYEDRPADRRTYDKRADADMRCDLLNAEEGAHVHTPGPVKFNGGDPVRLCDGCRKIIGQAEVSDL
jgi:hypothetical protein